MKKILSLVLTAALALSLFSGCRFERRNVGDSSASDKSSFSSSSFVVSHIIPWIFLFVLFVLPFVGREGKF